MLRFHPLTRIFAWPIFSAMSENPISDIESKVMEFLKAHKGTTSQSKIAQYIGKPMDETFVILLTMIRKGIIKSPAGPLSDTDSGPK